MKKIATILMLVVAVLVGGTTLDAKTTKKKGKSKTTQTSSAPSAQWNGDIPSAKIIEQFFMGSLSEAQKSKYKNQFINHGYHFEDYDDIAIKEGVCEIEVSYSQSIEIYIKVYDPELRNWLYNNIRSFKKSQKSTGRYYGVYLDGDTIYFGHSKWSYD